MKQKFFDKDTKLLCHLQKKDPRKPFGEIKVVVKTKEDASIAASAKQGAAPAINITSIGVGFDTNGKTVGCWDCQTLNDYGQDFCIKCGESLKEIGYAEPSMASVGFIENYYGGGSTGGANFMS